MNQTWDIKYAPQTLEEYIFNDEDMKNKIYELKKIPHMMFIGEPGVGKTTLAKLLVKHFEIDDMDIMFINASCNNGIDIIREKISNFVSTSAYGEYKVVIFDEADGLSLSAQSSLKTLLDEYANDASFIFTSNHGHKILGALQSRCMVFNFKAADYDSIMFMMADMLVSEDIKFKAKILKEYVSKCYPDIRHTIIEIQSNCVDGVLLPYKAQLDIVDYIVNDDWRGLRESLSGMKDIDYDGMYENLYNNLGSCEKFKDVEKYESGILIIAGYLANGSMNPMLNLIACIIELSRV